MYRGEIGFRLDGVFTYVRSGIPFKVYYQYAPLQEPYLERIELSGVDISMLLPESFRERVRILIKKGVKEDSSFFANLHSSFKTVEWERRVV